MATAKELWTKLWGFLKPYLSVYKIFTFLKSKTFLVLVIIIITLALGRSCARMRDAERKNEINEQNITALTDTIKTEKTKSGKQQVSISGFIASLKDLERLNGDLYKEVKDQKGNVISLTKVVFQLRQDTFELRSRINYLESIMSQPIQINDTTYKISWTLKYDWDSTNFDVYKGQTFVGVIPKGNTVYSKVLNNFDNAFNISFDLKHFKTEIIDRLSQVDLTFGQKIEDKQLRVFVNTRYPGFTSTSLQGVLIDPNTNPYIRDIMKKKRWFPNTWSVGVGPSFGYDVFTTKPYLGIGVNINYNLLQW